MARRANPSQGATATEEHGEKPAQVGGAPGVLPELSSTIHYPGMPSSSAKREVDPNAPPPPKVRRFRVINGGFVMYEQNPRVPIRAGKIVDDVNYNINTLKAQGIQLEELKD